MGSNIANRHEVPAEVVERARLVVDDVEQCRIEAGDLMLANIDWNVVEPLSEIVKTNTKAGGDRRLTLFKYVWIALEDVAVAAYVYEATPARSSADPSRATR
jgi:1-piperideine-2-carboxylate/1-pyrroline-2-carboxylate reductase [NAD(P)H]